MTNEKEQVMTKTDATKGKSYAGNPYMRFDEGKCLVGGNARRGILLNNGGILRKFHLLTIASLLTVLAAHAETWYLNTTQDEGTNKAWNQSDSGKYWTNSKDEKGNGKLVSTDTYYLKNGITLRGSGQFAGGNLWIGDPDATDYKINKLQMYGTISCPNGSLNLVAGYARKSQNSSSTYNLYSPIVWSPKEKPFGFITRYDNHKIGIKNSFTGGKDVGFVVGGHYDGNSIKYMTTTNATLLMDEAVGLANYHGEFRVVSEKPLTSPTKGNVTFSLHPTQSDATLEIESGAEFKIASAGEVRLSGLTLHAESLLTIPYNSTSHTTGVVRVTDTFSIPENEGKVRLWFETLPAATNDQPCAFPVLIVPDTQTLEVERFILSNEASVNVYEKPLFRVIEDSENRTKSLVAIFPGRGRLTKSNSSAYNKTNTDYDFSVHASAFTNATNWSDDNLPHEFAIYEFGSKSDWGFVIRTPFNRADDYVFPGLVLRSVGTKAIFVLADNTKTTINLELTSPLSLNVVKGKDPTLAGTVRMDDDVTSSAWSGSLVTIDSVLSGNGNWTVSGKAGTGSPNSRISFTADNSEWKGAISLKQDIYAKSEVPGAGNSKHQKLLVTNPAGLGGVLDEFNCKALSLADFSEVIVTNSLELAKDLNRGIYIVDNAIVRVDAGSDFVCNWPITFNGRLYKTKAGTLSLGGAAQFLEVTHITNITENVDDSGNVTAVTNIVVDEQILVDGIQKDPSKRQLTVEAGAVKALAYDCINGVTVDFKANADTSLVLEFNPADDNLKRYGFYNVKTDTPFAAGGTINVRIDNPDPDAPIASKEYKLGLITVKTLAANALNLDSLIKFNKPAEFENLRVRMIREDDGETGFTTYSAYYDFVGFQVIVR